MTTLTPLKMGGNLEERLAKLESVLKIGADGSLTIECHGKIKIKAATSVEIEGTANVVVKGASNVEISAGANLTLKGAAQTNLQGSMLKLNNGLKPVARTGDLVMNSGGPPGTVQGGAMTILA